MNGNSKVRISPIEEAQLGFYDENIRKTKRNIRLRKIGTVDNRIYKVETENLLALRMEIESGQLKIDSLNLIYKEYTYTPDGKMYRFKRATAIVTIILTLVVIFAVIIRLF